MDGIRFIQVMELVKLSGNTLWKKFKKLLKAKIKKTYNGEIIFLRP